MFDANGVPTNGMLYIFATADVVTPESAAEGMADRSGWVSDLDGSDVWDMRNYVSPPVKVHWPIAEQDDADEVRDVLEYLGAYETDGNEPPRTLYAADAVTHDYTTDETWSYALHAFVKHNGPNGWVETPVDIRDI